MADQIPSSPRPTQTASSLGPTRPSSPYFVSSDRGGAKLFSQISLGTLGSENLGTPRKRRGDLNPSNTLEQFLASENNSIKLDDPANVDRIIWGTTVNIEDSIRMFRDFVLNYSENDTPFYNEVLKNMKDLQMYNMNLDCEKLKNHPPALVLYHQLIRYPQEIIPLMDHCLNEIFLEKFQDAQIPVDQSIKVRPFNLGRNVNMRDLNPSDIDQLVSVKGLLIRASPVIPDLKRAFFRCTSCDHTIEVENDRGVISEPTKCEVPSCKKTNSMQLIHNRCVFSDKQVCRLQETPDETPDGQTPYTVSMCVYDDLMDVAKPGDRIEITGIFRGIPVRVNPNRRAIKALFKTYVDIVHIKRTDKNRIGIDKTAVSDNEYQVIFEEGDSHEATTPEEEEAILEMSRRSDLYELLSRSIAPSIFGMEDVKKGILLQLFGGSHKFSKNRAGSPRIRGDLNILLVGDPGVSKSQLLQYVHKLAPRGVYTSGKGSSAVGLTAYITRDPDTRQLVLESGALVLSDGGVCCIDEFDKMSESTRSILHEVMEQQTISVAKAGIITTLNARTSILACANPINSKFDKNLSVPQNVNLPPPLMSRFDLLYLILDKPNEQDDRRLAQHLVSLYISEKPTMSQVEFVPLQTFTRYINQAKKIQPVLSEEAGQALVNYYIAMRKSGNSGGGQNVISFTTRQLESMIRLSEAHAKMRLSSIVEKRDVEEANRLVLSALQTAAVDPRTGKIDLDLVTTGISSWGRKVHEQKRVAVRQVIQQSEKQVMKWVQVFKTFIDQSDLPLTETEFNGILKDLVDEGIVHVTGRTNPEKVIRRLQ